MVVLFVQTAQARRVTMLERRRPVKDVPTKAYVHLDYPRLLIQVGHFISYKRDYVVY